MKNTFLGTIVFCFCYLPLYGDTGHCLVYSAKFYLKNGAVFKGSFEVCAYDGERVSKNEKGINKYCNDSGVFELFKMIAEEQGGEFYNDVFYEGKVAVFKNIRLVKPLSIKREDKGEIGQFCFIQPGDLLFLSAQEISSMTFIRLEEIRNNYFWHSYVSGNKSLRDTMENRRYWNMLQVSYPEDSDTLTLGYGDYGGGILLINYNPGINQAELKRLALLKMPPHYSVSLRAFKIKHKLAEGDMLSENMQHLFHEEQKKSWRAAKQWFRRKGVIWIDINGYC